VRWHSIAIPKLFVVLGQRINLIITLILAWNYTWFWKKIFWFFGLELHAKKLRFLKKMLFLGWICALKKLHFFWKTIIFLKKVHFRLIFNPKISKKFHFFHQKYALFTCSSSSPLWSSLTVKFSVSKWFLFFKSAYLLSNSLYLYCKSLENDTWWRSISVILCLCSFKSDVKSSPNESLWQKWHKI